MEGGLREDERGDRGMIRWSGEEGGGGEGGRNEEERRLDGMNCFNH